MLRTSFAPYFCIMKVILTGTTGMVGEGVMLVALANPNVTEVLSVSRRQTGHADPKLKELVIPDFLALDAADPRLQGYDACFFCAGVSSVGMKEAEYTRATYDTTMSFARAFNPDKGKTFIYVSGGGTDSTGKGRLMWARVKGRTENDLNKMPFKRAFAFRPGIMIPVERQKRVLKLYRYLSWLVPVFKLLTPQRICTLQQVGEAMIQAAQKGYEKNVVEVRDIKILAARAHNTD